MLRVKLEACGNYIKTIRGKGLPFISITKDMIFVFYLYGVEFRLILPQPKDVDSSLGRSKMD